MSSTAPGLISLDTKIPDLHSRSHNDYPQFSRVVEPGSAQALCEPLAGDGPAELLVRKVRILPVVA